MSNQPKISWYEETQETSKEITTVVDYGTVEADFPSNEKVFYIWNNRNSNESVSKMEEVTFVTKDRNGGTGDTVGSIVQAVKDNWLQVRVDTLSESSFTAVGKDHAHPIGTTGTTINPHLATATEWSTGAVLTTGTYVKPTASNDFIYKVTVGGTTGASEPTWALTEGNVVNDDAVQYTTVATSHTPSAQEILGVANSVKEDGSDASNAGGNFVKITAYADVPVTASSGKNSFIQRVDTGTHIQ